MTTPLPPAGWYPDPTGKPGEMYWDGEAWHRLTPGAPPTPKAEGVRSGNNPPAAVPATPEASVPASSAAAAATPPPSSSGHRAGVRLTPLIPLLGICLIVVGFLSGIPVLIVLGFIVLLVGVVLMVIPKRGNATPEAYATRSGNKLSLLIIGGFLLICVGAWFVAYPLGLVAKLHSPSSPSPGSPGSQQSQSPFYQEGYNSGTSGLARKGYGFNMYNTGATVAEMEHQACSDAINNESNLSSIQDADHPANQDDYMNGCLKAFSDHPPTGKPKPGPLNPYR